MDILLVKETGDAAFINGAIPTTDETRQSVGQRLKIKLQTFYGTWFMDETYGIPYIEQVMGRKRSKSAIDALIQAAITRVAEQADFNLFRRTCRMITGELVLPNEPTVTGYPSYSPCRQVAATPAPAAE